MSWENYVRQFEREFPRGSAIASKPGGGVVISVECAEGHLFTQEFDTRMPPNKARKHMQNKGARFWGSRTRCPEHAKKKDEPVNDTRTIATSTASDIALAAAQPISEEARVAKRMCVMLLEEQFDTAKGRYKNGYTDAKVAKEVGLAEPAVLKLREELFGPIKEPAEIAELRDKIAEFEERLASHEREAAAHRKASEEVRRQLHTSLGELTRRLQALIGRNGW